MSKGRPASLVKHIPVIRTFEPGARRFIGDGDSDSSPSAGCFVDCREKIAVRFEDVFILHGAPHLIYDRTFGRDKIERMLAGGELFQRRAAGRHRHSLSGVLQFDIGQRQQPIAQIRRNPVASATSPMCNGVLDEVMSQRLLSPSCKTAAAPGR